MDINQIRQPVTNFVKALSTQIKVDDVILFGSYSDGSASDESDIDLLVISESFESMDEDARLDMLYTSSRFMKPEIHPWGYTRKELQAASRLSLLGAARDTGMKMDVATL